MFANISRVVAILALLGCVLEFALAIAIGGGFLGPQEQALARYAAQRSMGGIVDDAWRLGAIALVLGTIAEIAIALRKPKPPKDAEREL